MAFFAIDELIALGHGRSLAKKAAAFFRNSFSCRSSRTSALSFAISADSEAFFRSWSVACAFLYLATQLPTVWGTRSYDEATEEMVRSFSTTSRTTCSLNSSEYLAAGIVFILSTHGKKNSPSPRNTTHPKEFLSVGLWRGAVRGLVLMTVLRVLVWVVGCSPLVEDGGVGVGGAEGEDGAVAHGSGSGGQLGGSLVVG